MIKIGYFFVLILLISCGNTETHNSAAQSSVATKKGLEDTSKLLRHVVLFNFNSEANVDMVKKIEQEFASLSKKISEIHSFEWGINNSPEGLDKGFTHCFLVTFLSEEDREKYLPHPDHQAFVKLIGPYIEDVTVIDYWTS